TTHVAFRPVRTAVAPKGPEVPRLAPGGGSSGAFRARPGSGKDATSDLAVGAKKLIPSPGLDFLLKELKKPVLKRNDAKLLDAAEVHLRANGVAYTRTS